ncbi:TPA: hypothetical protein ONB00_003386 [Pseudomonas aeruginosa]|nr:hypothetical protein IPC325_31860 [Pseudomonas aeruginosa]HCR1674869.1 hypothetical protein [Pseudomonas aeruginosa]HDS0928695.1 hypothetical protein [Pseudomonas putida]
MYWTGSVGRMGGRNGIFGAGWSGLILLAGVALLAPEAAYAGKLGQALGSAAGSVGGTAVGGVSAEATRQALAAKGMTEDDFFRMLFARGIPRAKQDLPKMVDAETEFYDVTGSGREWGYWYRFRRYASRDLDPAAVKKALGPEIISKVCATPNMVSPFMEMGGTYRYNYVGRDGQLIMSVRVSRQDCN